MVRIIRKNLSFVSSVISMILFYILLLLASTPSQVRCQGVQQLCSCSLIFVETDQSLTELLDLTAQLAFLNPMRSIADLGRCEQDCRAQFAAYFNSNALVDTPDNLPVELNTIPGATDLVCQLLGRESSAPGQTVLIRIAKFGSQSFSKLINLTKICCHR